MGNMKMRQRTRRNAAASGRRAVRQSSRGALDQRMNRSQFLRTSGFAAAGVGAAAMGFSGVAQAKRQEQFDSIVYPNGDDFPADFPDKYPLRSDNLPWDWIFGPVPPEWGFPDTYFANIYTYDALEIMAAIHGGKAEDYWKPIRYDYDPNILGWVATELDDPFPYQSTGRTYTGGGRILLKATNKDGGLTPFNLGTWNPYMANFCFSLTVCGDCELVGEVLVEQYDASSLLAGRNRMAEIVNGTAGIGINFFRDDTPDYFGGSARTVTLRNLVLKDALFFALGIYGAPWFIYKYPETFLDRQDVKMENVHILDVWTVEDDFTMAVLSHSFGGSLKVDRCSVLHSQLTDGVSFNGLVSAPNTWGEGMDIRVTNSEFSLPPASYGSTAVIITGWEGFPQTALMTGNSIEADIGFEVSRDYFGTAVITQNPGPRGHFKARTMGFNVSGYEEGTSVMIDRNSVVMDGQSNVASELPFSAGFFGLGLSLVQIELSEFDPEDVGEPHNVVFSNNRVSGIADVGVYLGETASNNLFKANNISNLQVESGLLYQFDDDTTYNIVIGKTGGIASVYPGSDTNVFTGPGFKGLGKDAAQQIVAATAAAKENAKTLKLSPMKKGWHMYKGPKQ